MATTHTGTTRATRAARSAQDASTAVRRIVVVPGRIANVVTRPS
jgi:hypothetical protein